MSAEAYDEVSALASQIPTQLLNLYKKKVQKGKSEHEYDNSVRKFCISLHMKSASAYRHVRKCFENGLPSERTLRRCTVKVVIIKSNVMRHLSPVKLHVAVLKKSSQKRHKQCKCDT
jgi:hypothetical protein